MPRFTHDYADSDHIGDRIDGRHLIDEWIDEMQKNNKSYKFIWNTTEFRKTDMKAYDHVLGNVCSIIFYNLEHACIKFCYFLKYSFIGS